MTPTITRFAGIGLAALAATALSGCETIADAVVDEGFDATLTGASEVPGPGDPDGSGMAELTLVGINDQACYELNVSGIGQATAAHVHRGTAGVAGPPVLTLEPPSDGSSEGCVDITDALRNQINESPSGFYVNVHNAEYPNGALRGQLRP